MKKAQIALFIILGTIMLFVVSIAIYLVFNIDSSEGDVSLEKVQDSSFDDDPVKVYVGECIKQSAANAAYVFGFQQGYHSIPLNSLRTENNDIAYYYHEGKDIIPKNKLFEDEFTKIMNSEIEKSCTDFSIFEERGYEIEWKIPKTKTSILEDEVFFDIKFPLKITKDEITEVKRFSYTLPFRIGHIIDISRELTEAIVKEPYSMDFTLFLNQDVDVSVFNYGECNQIYILLDNESKLLPSDDEYMYSFAVKFEDKYCSNEFETEFELPETERSNSNPILDNIPYLTAQKDQVFSYGLFASDEDGDTLFYHLTGILKEKTHILTGNIELTPGEQDIGVHLINVSVIDLKGGLAEQQFYFEVK